MRTEVDDFFLLDLIHFENALKNLNWEYTISLSDVHMQRLVPEIMRENVCTILCDFDIREEYLLVKYVIHEPSVP
jgi:hypothetical protein